jgi:hypothetical protein
MWRLLEGKCGVNCAGDLRNLYAATRVEEQKNFHGGDLNG